MARLAADGDGGYRRFVVVPGPRGNRARGHCPGNAVSAGATCAATRQRTTLRTRARWPRIPPNEGSNACDACFSCLLRW